GDGAGRDEAGQVPAFGGGQHFGVVDAGECAGVGRHNDRTGDDGSGEAAASDFVDAGNEHRALAVQVTFDGGPALAVYAGAPARVRAALATHRTYSSAA